MVTFADTTAPRELRLERALRAMRERLGTSTPPTRELYEELTRRYDVTEGELGQAWIRAGLS